MPMPLSELSRKSLDELLEEVSTRYTVDFEEVIVGKYRLDILQITDLESHIEDLAEQTGHGQKLELPFWAKIWPTSIILGYYVQSMNPDPNASMLEIGAGVGVSGLFAARHGFQVILSDNQEDALLFSRINILKNGLQDRARVAFVDFTKPHLEKYQYIIGSEILYMNDIYRPLVKFLNAALHPSPGSEVILSKSYNLKATKFFNLVEKDFVMKTKTVGYRENTADDQKPEKHLSQIIRLRPKKVCSC